MAENIFFYFVHGFCFSDGTQKTFADSAYLTQAIASFSEKKLMWWEHVIENSSAIVVGIYNSASNNCYIVKKTELNLFLGKYFPQHLFVHRVPDFFSFNIPFPEIEYPSREPSTGICIGEFKSSTYQPLSRTGVLKLSYRYNRQIFDANSSDYFFFKEFSSVLEFQNQYKDYLSSFLNTSSHSLCSHRLITPYFQLTSQEFQSVLEIAEALREKDEYEEQSYDAYRNELAQQKEKDNFYEEQYRQSYLEGDYDNYFNID
ncbi:MAG TPA: hypothetical protein VL093_01855 [Flavipsychrobacter sp.]|nr:hypothetical protein [Flavipsychrobacter sp.]